MRSDESEQIISDRVHDISLDNAPSRSAARQNPEEETALRLSTDRFSARPSASTPRVHSVLTLIAMSIYCSTTTTLECLPHEMFLCIWDNLSQADAIFSFSHLNHRFTSLLVHHCNLHHQWNLSDSALASFRFFCRAIERSSEWCSSLTVLRLGTQFDYAQVDLLANAVRAAMQRQHSAVGSNVIFPRLISLHVDQVQWISDEVRDTLLYRMASASTLRTMRWASHRQQSHHALPLFNWLFLYSPTSHLTGCQVRCPWRYHHFELTYAQTLAAGYSPHHSLVSLTIDVRNWTTLQVLLHYLPRLEHLGKRDITSLLSFSP